MEQDYGNALFHLWYLSSESCLMSMSCVIIVLCSVLVYFVLLVGNAQIKNKK